MPDARAGAVVAAGLVLAGCFVLAGQPERIAGTAQAIGVSPADRQLVTGYFDQLNAAAADGVAAEQDYLRRTQVREFADRLCGLNGVTIVEQPTLSTLRPDPAWRPAGSRSAPEGTVYVVAVTLSIKRGTSTLGSQIGSQRIVVRQGTAYGFTPCQNQ
ncbi:hypothetical protein GCM10010174_86660 [Kutzneria viridogrisea]|uniref:Uncharacterized protein n=2 Tax=Kutzneria TaxID=43356 RepID=W5WLW0_9PSEU|nr:hypothetical protein [Kutzneria albida]AHI01858.1 hypothetical protein KALB_8501 [Kutzneria albida DSM 43870]MBA8929721.1 hypothetical protein [Kutzneria viridogrisea]